MEREGAAATTNYQHHHISGVPFISYSQSIPNSFVSFCRQFICAFRSFRDFLAVAAIPNMERMFANQNKSAIKRGRQEEKWPVRQEIEPSKDLNISFDSYGFYFSTSCRCLSKLMDKIRTVVGHIENVCSFIRFCLFSIQLARAKRISGSPLCRSSRSQEKLMSTFTATVSLLSISCDQVRWQLSIPRSRWPIFVLFFSPSLVYRWGKNSWQVIPRCSFE